MVNREQQGVYEPTIFRVNIGQVITDAILKRLSILGPHLAPLGTHG